MPMLFDELKERILHEYDVDLLCELLDINSEDLLDAFEYRLLLNLHKFEHLEEFESEEENEDEY